MTAAEPSLARRALGELLWGRRGAAKCVHLWLPLSLALWVAPRPAGPARLSAVALLAMTFCWAQAAILVNDLADARPDRAAGKRRWIAELPPPTGLLAVALLIVAGAVIPLAVGRPGALAPYAAAVVLALAYSLRPLRLKERGAVGLAAYSASGAAAFALTPWAWRGAFGAPAAVVAAAVLLDKWVNLHFHQVLDCEADAQADARTYAVGVGAERARHTLQVAACLAAAALMGAAAVTALAMPAWAGLVAALTCAGLAAGAVHSRRAARSAQTSPLLRELPWHYLSLSYVVLRVLPLVVLARLVTADGAAWPALALAAANLALESSHVLRYRYA